MSLKTLLIPPVQRIITIPPTRSAENYTSPPKDYFVHLPNELLILIFSLLEAEESPHELKVYQWSPLTRVCRRWHDIIERMLYRTLLLKDRNSRIIKWWETDKPRLSKLLVTLQERPHLRSYAQALSITVDDIACSEDIFRIVDLLPCIRQLSLHLDLKDSCLPFLERMTKMKLEQLEFFGYGAAPSLNMLFDILETIPTLRKLATYRWGWSRDGRLYTDFVHDDSASITAKELSRLLQPDRQRSSGLTCLDLQDPKTSIDVTECLFLRPARLQEVSLTSLCYGPYDGQYRATNIQHLLSIHQETLQKVSLGSIPPHGREIPDFSNFPSLQALHITLYKADASGWQSPISIYNRIAAPCLRHLEIDLGSDREPNDRWMTDFIALVRLGRQQTPPHTCLECVEFKFRRFGDLAMGLARRSSVNCESVRHCVDVP
ncbi:F-box protein [Aspergillus clavatus NRRL 1]|uniref:F-box domain protein n=1 Tax=Aspergillus clavatus (strain ATCC 1007 / CBS 513.65 / DSM 816 / NCTC 3887 / NRRL 1 / QM 1276 / 107) TaxID=344612 RepID=A1CDY1_ASPCL|nr:F-box domain protein [Aspergillus clavatus NRRL 1]EAW12058.1 F-box domain protein [Aspergillus clavatus NRRL 1]